LSKPTPVYKKVRQYLEDHGIRQNFVARKINISASTFNAIMTGQRRMFADELRTICEVLNVTPEVFIEVGDGTAC
jgi:transcriptional regulator with XRE-family HTH domain